MEVVDLFELVVLGRRQLPKVGHSVETEDELFFPGIQTVDPGVKIVQVLLGELRAEVSHGGSPG
jgi:hypothetical protein